MALKVGARSGGSLRLVKDLRGKKSHFFNPYVQISNMYTHTHTRKVSMFLARKVRDEGKVRVWRR